MNNQQNKKFKTSATLKYISFGTQLAILLLVAVWGGIKLDGSTGMSPLFLIVFPIIALAYSLYSLYRKLSEQDRKHE